MLRNHNDKLLPRLHTAYACECIISNLFVYFVNNFIEAILLGFYVFDCADTHGYVISMMNCCHSCPLLTHCTVLFDFAIYLYEAKGAVSFVFGCVDRYWYMVSIIDLHI